MKARRLFPAFLCAMSIVLFTSCNCDNKADKIQAQFKEISDAVKKEFAPDWRRKTWEARLSVSESDGSLVLRGATTERDAKEELLKVLEERGFSVLDSMAVLPDPALGEKIYGITGSSVINFRVAPDYDAESATQTVMGTPLRILEKRGGWTRAMTPEGYIAWVSSGSIQEMTKEEYNRWMSSEKLVITSHYTLFRDSFSEESTVVSDGVMGNIVLLDGGMVRVGSSKIANYAVTLPNGKRAFVSADDAMPYDKWIESRNPNPDNIIATAKQFLGFPYMWGGTSIKAMDCSGFTKTVYYLNGVILQRDASQQALTGEDVDISAGFDNLMKGDLLFFGTKATAERGERVTHVGIYIANGEFIHSATLARINSLIPAADNYYEGSTRFVRARRIIPEIDKDSGITSIKSHPWYSTITD